MEIKNTEPSWEVGQAILEIVESVSSCPITSILSCAYASQLQHENVVVIKFAMSTAALRLMSDVEYPSSIPLWDLARKMMISESVAGMFCFEILPRGLITQNSQPSSLTCSPSSP